MESQANERAEIERGAFSAEISAGGEDPEGRLRIRGVMHSFGKTYSRRLLHPAGFQNWLKRNPGVRLPMMAQHGWTAASFATIGQWDKISFDGKRAVWEGWIGQGTDLQSETRSLVKQGLVKQLSWGWIPIKKAWVSVNDKDLDPHFEQILRENDWPDALAYLEYDVVEGSLVDVADDPGARVAARAGAQRLELLEAELKALRGDIDDLKQAGGSADVAALLADVQASFDSFLDLWRDKALEMIATDLDFGEAAAELRELAVEQQENEDSDDDAVGTLSGDAEIEQLRARIARRLRA